MSQQLSRTLTKILRHDPRDLKISEDGYVSVDDLLQVKEIKKQHATLEKLQEITKNCSKQRFHMMERDGEWLIRANQGHSAGNVEIDDEKLMTPITLEQIVKGEFPVCVHGTYLKALPLIEKSGGLSRMARRHIHFSSFNWGDKETISGMRKNAQVLIRLDLERAVRDGGLKFYLSSNKVILSPGNENGLIPVEYFEQIVLLGKS